MSDTSSSGNEPVSAVRKFQVRVRTKPNHGSIGGSGEGTPIGTPPTTSAVFVNRNVHNNTGSPAASSLSSSPVTTTATSSSSATTVEETTATAAVVSNHSPASSPVNSPRVITSSIVKGPIRRISTQPTLSPSSDSPSTSNNNTPTTTTTTTTTTAVTSNHVPPPVPPTSGATILPSRRDISVPMPTRKSLSANGSVVGSTSERIIQSALFNRRISSTVPQLVQDSPLSSSPNTTTATATATTTTTTTTTIANNTSTTTESAQTEKNTSDDTSASAPSSPSSTNTLAGSSTRSHRYSITNTLQQRLQQQQQPDDASPNNSNNSSRRYSSSWGSTTHMGYKNTLKLLNKDQANQLYGECDVKCYYLMNPLYDEQEASPEVQYHLTSDECKLYDQVIQRIQEIGKDPNNHLIVQYETMVAQAVRDDQNYKPMLQKRLAQGSESINLSRRRLMNLNGSATDGAPLPSAANTNSVEEKSSEEILLEESMNHNNNNKRHSIAQCSKGWKQQMRARDMNTPFVFNQRAPIATTNLMKQSYPWMNQMVMRHYLATQ